MQNIPGKKKWLIEESALWIPIQSKGDAPEKRKRFLNIHQF